MPGLSDARRHTTYDPFGTKYEVEQWQPPGGIDPMAMLPLARGARAAGALRQLPRSWMNDPAAGLAAAYDLMPVLFPPLSGIIHQVVANPRVHRQEVEGFRDQLNQTGNLARYYGDQLQDAGQATRAWWSRPGQGGLTPLPGQPY